MCRTGTDCLSNFCQNGVCKPQVLGGYCTENDGCASDYCDTSGGVCGLKPALRVKGTGSATPASARSCPTSFRVVQDVGAGGLSRNKKNRCNIFDAIFPSISPTSTSKAPSSTSTATRTSTKSTSTSKATITTTTKKITSTTKTTRTTKSTSTTKTTSKSATKTTSKSTTKTTSKRSTSTTAKSSTKLASSSSATTTRKSTP
ncbi:hypothetical protein CF319_g7599 [Tilletia indica]|nr:hypothetical protein CF319_g7599 [Tilletia indica]